MVMTMIHGSGQFFNKRDVNGRITLLMAKTVDDFLISGIPITLDEFLKRLNERFEVGKTQLGLDYTLNGCYISRDIYASVKLSMDDH